MRLIVTFVAYIGLVAFALVADSVVLGLACAPVLGFLLSTLLPVMHEATHGHLGRSRALNDAIGRIAGALLTVNYTLYKRYHLKHHAKLGSADDPELPVELTGIGSYMSYLSPRYLLLAFWTQQLRFSLGERPPFIQGSHMTRAVHLDNLLVVAWAAVMAGLLIAWPRGVVLYYLLPLWLAPAWMFLTTIPEHYRLRGEAETLTRTVRSGPLMSFFLWNTNHHVQHHENPGIPFEELPTTHWSSNQAEVTRSFTTFHMELLASLLRTRGAV